MRCKGCVISEQKFADEDTPDLRFGTESGNVEELAICSCVELNPLISVVKHILEKQ